MSHDEFHLGEGDEAAVPMIAHIAHDTLGFHAVPAMKVGDMAVFQGDILLGPVRQMKDVEAKRQAHRMVHEGFVPIQHLPPTLKAAITPATAWEGRKVYYQIEVAMKFVPRKGRVPFEPPRYLVPRQKVKDAIKLWEATGLFKFYEREHVDGYILFKKSDRYESYLGRTGTKQELKVPPGVDCAKTDPARYELEVGKIAHEIGHALGLPHENQRRDALSYVKTYWNHIKEQKRVNYLTQVEGLKVGFYDYESIMHYPKTSGHAITIDATLLEALDHNATADLGQRKRLAISDLNAATAIYADGVSKITVELTTGAIDSAGALFLGIAGREFRLAPDKDSLEPNTEHTFTFEGSASGDDPNPLSISYVLGLPIYLRLEGSGARCTVKQASVDLTIREIHKAPWKKMPNIGYLLKKDKWGVTLGPDCGRTVHLHRQAPEGFTPHTPESGKRKIHNIVCSFPAGTSPTEAHEIYLGLAGREFRLANGSATADGQSVAFTFAKSASGNDPTDPQLTEADLQEFPMYFCAEGVANWELEADSRVAVELEGSSLKPIHLKPVVGRRLQMNPHSGAVCGLKYDNAPPYPKTDAEPDPQPDWVDGEVSTIAVTVCGAKSKAAGPPHDLYLGLGGREFNLAVEPVGGHLQGQVEDRVGGMSMLDLETYPAYIRKGGDDPWSLKLAYVTALFVNARKRKLYRGRCKDKSLGIWWSRPTLEKAGADGANPEMTVSFTSQIEGVSLGVRSGKRCALVRTRPLIEVVFVLDTTGSMDGLIQGARHMIRDVVDQMRAAQPTPEIRVGLLGYRDRGDAYVTKPLDLTGNVESMLDVLEDFHAQGGGDLNEAVNQALYEAVNRMSWTRAASVYKVVFLVGDAPPKTYSGEQGYLQTLRSAAAEGIVFNTVQCGDLAQTTRVWNQIAVQGGGLFGKIPQDGKGFDQKVLAAIREQSAAHGFRHP